MDVEHRGDRSGKPAHRRAVATRTGGEHLIRLSLRVYNATVDATLRERAMDAFDGLTERYEYEAQSALGEWDEG